MPCNTYKKSKESIQNTCKGVESVKGGVADAAFISPSNPEDTPTVRPELQRFVQH